ncbi:MAG: GAF domain-containing sensor histidine kinase [Candidatus Lernaella stagnicola]|nr:GAF domain-containing sensor histidine kinase [Candidatus Lernaella stagnicola]
MKPEIAATLFSPVITLLKESDIPFDRWSARDSGAKPIPLEKRQWIDENTFRQLLDALLVAGHIRKLDAAARVIIDDESIGMGDLLWPFVDDPYEILSVMVGQISQLARTWRLTIQRVDDHECVVHVYTTNKRPGPPSLGPWLEALWGQAKRVPFEYEVLYDEARQDLVEQGPPTKAPEDQLPCCSYRFLWKKSRKPFFKRGPDKAVLARRSIEKARTIVSHQKRNLGDMQLRFQQQVDLLHGIVSLSEATKDVKSYRDLIHLTADRICSDFGFDRSMIYLARDGQLGIVSVIDPHDRPWAQTVFAACQANPIPLDGHSEEGKAFATGNPVIVDNPWNNIFVPQSQQEAWKSKGYVIVPIRGAGRIIGLMLGDHYYKRQPIDPEDVEKLQAISHISGMAIEKLRLIDRLEAKVSERTAELERANKKLMSLYSRARESDRLKSDFLANMSHELRTPLNSIIGFSKLILRGIDGPLSDKQETDISAILNSGTHLLGLINDILDLSKIESGRMELNMERFLVADLIESVITTGEGLIKEKPIVMKTNLDPAIKFIYGDHMRLRQVLINLVSNAVKFTEKGQVSVTTRAGGDEIYVAVTDTGVGIPADKVDQAFERFRQLDSGTSRIRGGSGLGLTICKRFVEMHGGRIWVTSTEGVGSTFHIALPKKSEMMTQNNENNGD